MFGTWRFDRRDRHNANSHAIEMSLALKQAELAGQLAAIKNSQERFAFIVRRGREYPDLEPALKTEANRVDGCLAKVWFLSELSAGRCYFKTDSDSAIVKGISVILCEFYSGETPEEILQTPPAFLETVGINQHLTANKRDSLTKIWVKIRKFASDISCKCQ